MMIIKLTRCHPPKDNAVYHRGNYVWINADQIVTMAWITLREGSESKHYTEIFLTPDGSYYEQVQESPEAIMEMIK